MQHLRTALAVTAATTLLAAPVSAQTAWDAPPLISHVAPAGVSLFLINPEGGDLGGLVTFRHRAGPVGLGYRVALSDETGTDDLAVSGGVDLSGVLARQVEGSEVDVMWWSGAGLGVGSETLIRRDPGSARAGRWFRARRRPRASGPSAARPRSTRRA